MSEITTKDLSKEFDAFCKTEKTPLCKCIVRLTTSYWHNKDGIQMKKSLRFLKRQCQGYNILLDDADNIGVQGVVERILNLDKCKDGEYEVITCNEWSSWETPDIIEDYNYKLIPLKKVDSPKTV